jgi:uncharacterized integral membrane protein
MTEESRAASAEPPVDGPPSERPIQSRSERGLAVGFLVVVLLLAVFFVVFALNRTSNSAVSANSRSSAGLPRSRIDLDVTPVSVDVLDDQMEIEVRPVLHGTIGHALGSLSRAGTAFSLFVDGAQMAVQKVNVGEVIESFDATVSLKAIRAVNSFPFDSYTGVIVASATTVSTPVTGSRPIPTVIRPEPPGVDGFRIGFMSPRGRAQSAALATGQWRTSVAVERDDNVRFVTLLIALILVLSALSVLAVGYSVVRGHRKVTVDMLAWMAIFPFALIVLREVVPGNPPDGVEFDIVAYYWPIALVFTTFLACVLRWLVSEDAD